jgi:hypothetical protein
MVLRAVRHRRPVLDVSPWYARGSRYLEFLGLGSLFFFAFGTVGSPLVVAAVCFGTSIAVSAWSGWANRRHRQARPRVRDELGGPMRLTCVGEEVELAPLSELPCALFEPIVVEVLPALRFDAPLGRELGQFSSSGLALAVAIGAAGIVGSFAVLLYDPFAGWCALLVAMVLFEAAVVLTGRKYLRVSPGRLEVLCPSLFSSKVRVIRTLDLITAQITCRYDKGLLEIAEPALCSQPLLIGLDGVPERHRLVEGVFRGAIATANVAALPEDALLG